MLHWIIWVRLGPVLGLSVRRTPLALTTPLNLVNKAVKIPFTNSSMRRWIPYVIHDEDSSVQDSRRSISPSVCESDYRVTQRLFAYQAPMTCVSNEETRCSGPKRTLTLAPARK